MMTALLVMVPCASATVAQNVSVPAFWDPNVPMERPQLSGQGIVRILTDETFPPLHFAGIDTIPTGFSVELARAVCDRLQITCTIQSRRFDTLLGALTGRQGDVVAAAFPITADLRQSYSLTTPYFKNPARFASRRAMADLAPTAQNLKQKMVGAVTNSAHEAYLRRFFPAIAYTPFTDLAAGERALKEGSIDYLFADGLNLALWLGGTQSDNCCAFMGGPFLENGYFGEGVGFIFRPEDTALRRSFDYALYQLWREGKYAELYLRFFPVSPY